MWRAGQQRPVPVCGSRLCPELRGLLGGTGPLPTRGPQALPNLVLSSRLTFLFILLEGCGPGACHGHSPSLGPPPGAARGLPKGQSLPPGGGRPRRSVGPGLPTCVPHPPPGPSLSPKVGGDPPSQLFCLNLLQPLGVDHLCFIQN